MIINLTNTMKKNLRIWVNVLLGIGLALILSSGCKKEENAKIPVLSTSPVNDINQTMAICGGIITSNGGFPITARGVCWSIAKAPVINGNKTISGATSGTFSDTITNLIANTVYYVRAYATNSEGTAYGNELSFTTSALIFPTLTTLVPNSMTQTKAISGGNITFDGGATIASRGVCWSITENPTIALTSKTTDGTGPGIYKSSLTGLTLGVKYYVRAYATNSLGTSYGEQKSLILDPTQLTDADSNVYNTITIGTQTWMKENLKTTKYLDGSPIPNINNDYTWGTMTTDAYCWYNNDAITNKKVYGGLYNFYAVQDNHGLCPTGWHVSTKTEWTILTTFLGGDSIAGKKLMESGGVHWKPYNKATNESGFTALPGGDRYNDGFYYLEFQGKWWSSTEYDTNKAWNPSMASSYIDVRTFQCEKFVGLSVRCVRDE